MVRTLFHSPLSRQYLTDCLRSCPAAVAHCRVDNEEKRLARRSSRFLGRRSDIHCLPGAPRATSEGRASERRKGASTTRLFNVGKRLFPRNRLHFPLPQSLRQVFVDTQRACSNPPHSTMLLTSSSSFSRTPTNNDLFSSLLPRSPRPPISSNEAPNSPSYRPDTALPPSTHRPPFVQLYKQANNLPQRLPPDFAVFRPSSLYRRRTATLQPFPRLSPHLNLTFEPLRWSLPSTSPLRTPATSFTSSKMEQPDNVRLSFFSSASLDSY
jgi:hypothetical protein